MRPVWAHIRLAMSPGNAMPLNGVMQTARRRGEIGIPGDRPPRQRPMGLISSPEILCRQRCLGYISRSPRWISFGHSFFRFNAIYRKLKISLKKDLISLKPYPAESSRADSLIATVGLRTAFCVVVCVCLSGWGTRRVCFVCVRAFAVGRDWTI